MWILYYLSHVLFLYFVEVLLLFFCPKVYILTNLKIFIFEVMTKVVGTSTYIPKPIFKKKQKIILYIAHHKFCQVNIWPLFITGKYLTFVQHSPFFPKYWTSGHHSALFETDGECKVQPWRWNSPGVLQSFPRWKRFFPVGILSFLSLAFNSFTVFSYLSLV